MKNTIKERVEEARKGYVYAQAMEHVYSNLLDKFQACYCSPVYDEETQTFKEDENGCTIYTEKTGADWYFDYNNELFEASKDLFKKLMTMLEEGKIK